MKETICEKCGIIFFHEVLTINVDKPPNWYIYCPKCLEKEGI